MSPTGDLPSTAASEVFVSLREYARRTNTGRAYTDNAAFIVKLAYRRSFSPDAAFYIGPRTGGKFLEWRANLRGRSESEGDYGRRAEEKMARKRADYFAAGTLAVWDVDVLRDGVIRCYELTILSPESVSTWRNPPMLNPPPGWTMPVDDLFA